MSQESIADRMQDLLAFANYSKVARALDVSKSAVSDWANGRDVTPFRLEQVERLLLRAAPAIAEPPGGYDLSELTSKVDAIITRDEVLEYLMVENYTVYDWWLLEVAAQRIGTGTTYEWDGAAYVNGSTDYFYRYSPLLPYLMAPFLAIGIWAWQLAHLPMLLALPRRLSMGMLLFGAFWFDVAFGNFLTPALALAWLAVHGNRWGQLGYFALTLLIPRPLMLPVAAWLLWKRPESRRIALGTAIVLGLGTLATGEAFAWANALLGAGDIVGTEWDWGPSRWLGVAWWPIGLALGVLLTWKGRLGLASLAVSPYILPYYFVIAAMEFRRR